jgi:hypothetical protein
LLRKINTANPQKYTPRRQVRASVCMTLKSNSVNFLQRGFLYTTLYITKYRSYFNLPIYFMDQSEGFPSAQSYYSGFCNLLLTSLLHVSVVRPSSNRNIFIGNYPSANGSVDVIRTLVSVIDNYSGWFQL